MQAAVPLNDQLAAQTKLHGAVDPLIYVDGRYTGLPADELSAPPVQSQMEMLRQLAMG